MANFGAGTSAIGRYVSEIFDGGLPAHVNLVLTPLPNTIVLRYGTAVIEKIGGAGEVMQLSAKTVWVGGATWAFDPTVDEEPTYQYRLSMFWKVAGQGFFWFHS